MQTAKQGFKVIERLLKYWNNKYFQPEDTYIRQFRSFDPELIPKLLKGIKTSP